MKIHSVEYAGTIAAPGGAAPGSLPQIAFSGRSNVGKSSLINTVLRRTRSKIARVSATPGKTRAINFFLVNDLFFLVDLPGYGYARAPEKVILAQKLEISPKTYFRENALFRKKPHFSGFGEPSFLPPL